MMIHPPAGATRRRKRIGRGPGSGLGKTSGRGHKGQNARSGGKVRPGFEGGQMPLYRRIARRGFSNYAFRTPVVAVHVRDLERHFEAGATVTLDSLRAVRLIGKNDRAAKVLSDGEITKALTVEGVAVSKAAKAKIEAAGGSVTLPGAEAEAETVATKPVKAKAAATKPAKAEAAATENESQE